MVQYDNRKQQAARRHRAAANLDLMANNKTRPKKGETLYSRFLDSGRQYEPVPGPDPDPDKTNLWDGLEPVRFGKHKGKTWRQMPDEYLAWMVENGHSQARCAGLERGRREETGEHLGLGEKIIPFGQFKGMQIADVDLPSLRDLLPSVTADWLRAAIESHIEVCEKFNLE